jgi:hypothetical protein
MFILEKNRIFAHRFIASFVREVITKVYYLARERENRHSRELVLANLGVIYIIKA